MSTKTSIKRIALVAVSALGFGLLSVVPAKAAITAATPTLTTPSITTSVGTNVSTTFTVVTTGTLADGDNIEYSVGISSAPVGSSMALAAPSANAAASAKVAFRTGSEATVAGWALTTTNTNNRTDTIATAANGANIAGSIRGTISVTPDVAGTYVFLLTANASAGTDGTATLTVVVNGQNAARNAFINKSTTVDDSGAAFSATALSSASASTTPGVSYTANGAITDSVAAMTVPAGAAIVFTLTGSATWSTGTKARLAMNGSTVAELTCTISTVSCVLGSYTAPTTVGAYNAVFTVSGANASFDPALTETISFTITVGSAASGLGDFGNTTDTSALHVSAVGVTVVDPSGRVGVPIAFAPNFTVKNGTGGSLNSNTKSARLRYSVTLPAGTAGSVVDARTAGVATTNQTVQGASESIATTASSAAPTIGTTVFVIPATAGTYVITVYHDANRDGNLSAGEASVTSNVVVAADALPSITFTKYGSNVSNDESDDGDWGQLVKVSLRNGTTPYTLAANESLVLTSAADTTDFLNYTSFSQGTPTFNDVNSGISTLTLTRANFDGNGDAWFNIGDTTDAGGTFSVSAVINGGTANGATGSFTITTINTDAATAATTTDYALVNDANVVVVNANNGLGTYSSANDASLAQSEAGDWFVPQGVATSVAAKITYGANNYKYYSAIVTDTLGLITGVKGGKYTLNALGLTTGAVAASALSLSVTIPATTAALATATTVATMVIDANTDITVNIKTQTVAVDSIAVDPTDLVTTTYSVRAAAASANTFNAYVLDQYGNALAGRSVTAQVTSGRNAQLVATSLLSDSTGKVSFKVTDTYTGTLLNSDTLKFISNAKEGVVTINYAAYNPASTVTITGGASADIAPTVTYNLINAGTSGASGTLVRMTATVKDANGATLPAGIPVTWAISGLTGTSAIYVDPLTGYDWSTSMTDSNGAAITYVYAWGTGTVSVTATAGAVTSATAGKINFANAAADARVVSATVNNNIITAKVVDRYGNPVKGVSLSATRNSGVGYFSGSASSSATGETNALGTVDFVMTGGAANVTVATTTLNAGQTSSAAAAVNGTAITATSIGASLSPAGVQSVTVDVTSDAPSNIAAQDAANAAADAAAEAIDAANAATDAANLAAEAADAATVAAEEARDAADAATAAVEELATQVATLMAALKAQITTLANTVAKIAKKVKA